MFFEIQSTETGSRWRSFDGSTLGYTHWNGNCDAYSWRYSYSYNYDRCRDYDYAILSSDGWEKISGSQAESLVCVKKRSEGY